MNTGKKIVVLGSNGFIGTHLVSWLSSQGYSVAGVDMVDKVDATLGLKKANHFYKLVLPDHSFEKLLSEFKPGAIISASGPASVAHSILDPSADFVGSVDVTFFVLESIRKVLPECRFLMLSSAAVYGNPATLPIDEKAVLSPISPYGYHKMMCEFLMKEYFEIYQVRTSVVRIFSAYGPGLRKQILWDVYKKAISHKQVRLFGTGKETRDFIHIRDIVRAIQMLLEKTNFSGDVFNVANGYEVSIEKLSQLFLAALGMEDKEIVFSGETKVGDPKRWRADIAQLKRIGYHQTISLEQGVDEYAKWVLEGGDPR